MQQLTLHMIIIYLTICYTSLRISYAYKMKVCTTVFIALFGMVSVLFAASEADSIVAEEHPCPCNEVWSDCGPPQGGCFEKICGDPSLEGTACKAPCRPSCYCGIGFIRQSADGPCIPEDKCPVICTTTT